RVRPAPPGTRTRLVRQLARRRAPRPRRVPARRGVVSPPCQFTVGWYAPPSSPCTSHSVALTLSRNSCRLPDHPSSRSASLMVTLSVIVLAMVGCLPCQVVRLVGSCHDYVSLT